MEKGYLSVGLIDVSFVIDWPWKVGTQWRSMCGSSIRGKLVANGEGWNQFTHQIDSIAWAEFPFCIVCFDGGC